MKADCSECCDILLPPRAFPVVQKFNIRLLVNPSPEANCLCVPLHSSLPLRSVQPFAMLWTGGLAVSTRFLQTLETEFKQKFEREKMVSVPAPCVILTVANVVFQVHLDLVTETLDSVHIAQAACIRIKEHDCLPKILVVA